MNLLFMCTFDLKSDYHHVDIHPDSQTYLGFVWKGDYYVFAVLPFGLATACYVFTNLLQPVVKYLCSKGVRVVVYIDDGIAVGNGLDRMTALSVLIRSTPDKAGFVFNLEKVCSTRRNV